MAHPVFKTPAAVAPVPPGLPVLKTERCAATTCSGVPNLSLEGSTFRDEGDWVVASFLLRGSGGASGAEVAEPYSWALRRTEAEAVAAIQDASD